MLSSFSYLLTVHCTALHSIHHTLMHCIHFHFLFFFRVVVYRRKWLPFRKPSQGKLQIDQPQSSSNSSSSQHPNSSVTSGSSSSASKLPPPFRKTQSDKKFKVHLACHDVVILSSDPRRLLVVIEQFHLENVSNGALSTIVNPCSSDTPFPFFSVLQFLSVYVRKIVILVALGRVGRWDGKAKLWDQYRKTSRAMQMSTRRKSRRNSKAEIPF